MIFPRKQKDWQLYLKIPINLQAAFVIDSCGIFLVTHLIKEKENRGMTGTNDYYYQKYGGPCPPSGTHRYCFTIYARDCISVIPVTSPQEHFEPTITDHIVAFGTITAQYRRNEMD